MSQSDTMRILDSVAYVLQHVDGAQWVSQFLLSPPSEPTATLSVGSVSVRQPSFRPITNALAEAGVMACRRSLNFLGLRVSKSYGELDVVVRRYLEDAGVELLGLRKVSPEELIAAPPGPPDRVREACKRILRAADKGVAHLTVDRGERAFAEDLLICALATTWAIEVFVYNALGANVPQYRVWTEA